MLVLFRVASKRATNLPSCNDTLLISTLQMRSLLNGEIRYFNGATNDKCESCKICLPSMSDVNESSKKKSNHVVDTCPKFIKLDVLQNIEKVKKVSKKDASAPSKENQPAKPKTPISSKEAKTPTSSKEAKTSTSPKEVKTLSSSKEAKTPTPSKEAKTGKDKTCDTISIECPGVGQTKASTDQKKTGTDKKLVSDQNKTGTDKKLGVDQKKTGTNQLPKEKLQSKTKIVEEGKKKVDTPNPKIKTNVSKKAKPIVTMHLGPDIFNTKKQSVQKGRSKLLIVGVPAVLFVIIGAVTVLSSR